MATYKTLSYLHKKERTEWWAAKGGKSMTGTVVQLMCLATWQAFYVQLRQHHTYVPEQFSSGAQEDC